MNKEELIKLNNIIEAIAQKTTDKWAKKLLIKTSEFLKKRIND